MATSNKKKNEALQQEKITNTVSRTEQFFNDNKKTLWGCLIAIVVIGLALLAYSKFIYQPKSAEAAEQMYPSEAAFRASNFDLALNGDGNTLGFAEIIKQYGKKAGSAVYLYAGICELNAGNFENAISYLKKYNGKDDILAARAKSCIGDAYAGLEDYATAASWFMKAAGQKDNVFAATYLLKAGEAYEALGLDGKALDCYKKIRDFYPQSIESYDISKYISRIESK